MSEKQPARFPLTHLRTIALGLGIATAATAHAQPETGTPLQTERTVTERDEARMNAELARRAHRLIRNRNIPAERRGTLEGVFGTMPFASFVITDPATGQETRYFVVTYRHNGRPTLVVEVCEGYDRGISCADMGFPYASYTDRGIDGVVETAKTIRGPNPAYEPERGVRSNLSEGSSSYASAQLRDLAQRFPRGTEQPAYVGVLSALEGYRNDGWRTRSVKKSI